MHAGVSAALRSFRSLKLVSAALVLLGAMPATAAITQDNTSTAVGLAGATSLMWNHTLGSGGNRMVVCTVAMGYNDTALTSPITVSMTFNGMAMTSAVQSPTHAVGSSSKIYSQIFYISDTTLGTPAAGSYPVVLTLPSAVTGGVVGGCTSLFGALQSAPEATGVAYTGSSAAVSVSLNTSTANDWVIDSFAGGYGSSGSSTPNTGQTLLLTAQNASGNKTTAGSSGGALLGASYEQVATPGAVTVGWAAGTARAAYAVAAFAPAPTTNYTITTLANPTGAGTISFSPTGTSFPAGTTVTLTANPAIGYTFTSFSGDITSTTNPSTILVNGNKTVTANYTASLCTLTVNTAGTGSGSVTLSPTAANNAYTCGTQVQVTAVPASGSSFGNFSGGLTGTTNPQTITLNTSSTVTANFVAGTACTLGTSVTTGSNTGSITTSPSGTSFSCGTSITVTATPAQYYSLTGFSGAITGTTNPQTFTLNSNSTIAAAFAQTNFPINTTIVGPGTVTANPADTGNGYPSGTSVQLTAVPNSGSTFSGFSGDLTGTTNPQTITVNAARNVTATFASSLITKDATSYGVTHGSASTLSWQHVLGAGGNRAIVIAVGQTDTIASPDPSSVVTSVTFNGIYATPVPNSIIYGGTSGSIQTQLFYLLESELPAAGTYTVTVNLAGTVGGLQAGAVSFFGVQQGGPEAVITHRDTSGADLISTSITTLTNNAVVVDSVENNNVAAFTANTGQTVAWTGSATSGTGASSYKMTPTAGATTLGWAGSASRLAHSLAAFAPATAVVPPTYTLTTSVAGGVGGTVSSNPNLSQYPQATGVLLTATAQTGYSFSGWTGDYTSTANPLPITMDSNRNVVANFTTAPTCTLAYNIVGTGTVTPAAGTYNCGTVLHFVATPGTGYTFDSYSGDFSSPDNPADFTLSANSNVTVTFDAVPMCSLNLSTVGSGTTSPASGSYACGSTITLQATAGGGYAFSGFTGDFTSTANPATIQLNSNMNIVANFTAGTGCTLTSSVTGQGTISPSSGTWACGTTIAIAANPASKYLFNGWGGALSGSTTTPTTLLLDTSKSVTATFVVNIAGVTGDTRTVTEPSYPAVCTTLTALQTSGSLVETSPDTTRVQAALNACAQGQAVEFSSNGSANAFIIAPITLPAGVTMLVDPEVTIYGSITSTDYPCTSSSFCKPLINVASNTAPHIGSAIMGLGVIDGRGGTTLTDLHKSWWATGSDARPRLVYLSSNSSTVPADNFTMYQITLKNSPKFEFSGIGNNLTIWDVKVIAPPDSPNTDGIDPSSSQNITITNSFVSTGDDMIAMKAGNGHIANVTISNNHMYSGHGITVGSETNAGLNNMLVIGDAIDNGFGGSSSDSLRIKSDTSRGGEVYDVLYKNICIKNGGDTIVIDPYYSSQTGSLIPNFHDITFSNIHKTVHNSSYKSTWTGYNTGGIVNPLTVTLDTVYFDGDAQNDFKAPDNVNNVQFTFGPGPVSAASFFTADAAVPSNYVTVTNSISNSNAALDCSNAFIYLAGDLTSHTPTVSAGASPNVIAVLQNVVSPPVSGIVAYPQQNAPTGNVQLLEGSTVVGSAALVGRIATINVPGITAGTHTYTAKYLGDGNYGSQSFGTYTITATPAAPVANAQSVTVAYNTATAITLTASGSGTLTYTVVSAPSHGTLSGTAPNLTYTPTSGYSGADSFTFKANNGTDSNVATVSITVSASGGTQQSQTITFPAPSTPVTYGAAAITLNASASSGLAVTYTVTGPATLSGTTLSYTGVGTVSVTASQAGNSSYSAATPVQQQIVVNQDPLTVALSGTPTRTFGEQNPAFSYSIGTFVNGDSQASATSGTPSITTSATPRSAAGSFPVTISQGTLASTNYSFNFVSGQLTVNGNAVQTIIFPPIPSLVHGTSFQLAAQATSGLPVTFSVTGAATISGNTLTVTGTGSVTVTAAQPGNGNFAAASSVSRTFTAQ